MVDFLGLQARRDRLARSMAGRRRSQSVRDAVMVSGSTYTQIDPPVLLKPVDLKKVELLQGANVDVESADLQLYVSKAYELDVLAGQGNYFLIDATLVEGSPVGGFRVSRVPDTRIEEHAHHWVLTVRHESDFRR